MSHRPRTKIWAGPLALVIAVAVAAGSSAQQRDREDDLRDEDRIDRYEEEYDADEEELRRAEFDREEAFGREERLDRREYRAERRPVDDTERREEAALGITITRDDRPGIVVGRVFRDSPAEQMGLRRGDRITRVNEEPVRTARDFMARIREMEPRQEVELEILRDREEFVLRGELEAYEEAFPRERPMARAPWTPEVRRDPFVRDPRLAPDPRFAREPDPRRLRTLERQVERLNRELQELRFAIRELRRGETAWDREMPARYEELEPERRPGVRWEEERWRDDRQRDPRFRDDRARPFDGR